jgi:hypothetical protein
VFAPERESEGDVDSGEYICGDVISSLVFGATGIAINDGFAVSISHFNPNQIRTTIAQKK